MKKNLLFILGMLITLPGFAGRTFEYNYEGRTLKYEVLDEDSKTCQTNPGTYSYVWNELVYYSGNYASGDVILPSHPEDETGEKYTLTAIGKQGFYKQEISSVSIPESVNTIGIMAFDDCTNLQEITLPDALKTIDPSAFSGCTGLQEITLPKSLKNISSSTFAGCSGLQQITLPDALETIGNSAFHGCTGLKEITLPDALETIGDSAFNGCTGLMEILIPSKVTKVGDYAFYSRDASSIRPVYTPLPLLKAAFPDAISKPFGEKVITLQYDTYDTKIVDGCLYSRRNDKLKYVPMNIGEEFTVPEGVTEIGGIAFYHCSDLVSVNLPNSLTTIDDSAFFQCESLASLSLPESLTTIGSQAFPFCKSLTTLTLPNSLTAIGNQAFYGCSNLTTVTLPQSLTTLGSGVWEKCDAIKTVNCYVAEPIAAERDLFTVDVYDSATLYVPEGSVAAYENAMPWSYFYNIKTLESGVENIPNMEDVAIDFNLPYEVFNLNGVKIAATTANLTAGIYIIRQGDNVKKIAVK